MLQRVFLSIQFFDNTVSGINGQPFRRPAIRLIGRIKHISKSPPLMDQLMDHDLAGSGSLARIAQILGCKIRLIQQTGSVRGISAAGNAALNELEGVPVRKGQGAVMSSTVFHHLPDSVHRPCGFHDGLMLSAVVKFYGDPSSLNFLPHIIARIYNSARSIGFIPQGNGTVFVLLHPFSFAGSEGNHGHGGGQGDFNGSGISVFTRQNIHQPGSQLRVFQAQIFLTDLVAALHGSHIPAFSGESAVLDRQLHLLPGGNRNLQFSLIIFLIVAHRKRHIHAVRLNGRDGITGVNAEGGRLLLTGSVPEAGGSASGNDSRSGVRVHLNGAPGTDHILRIGNLIKRHHRLIRIAVIHHGLGGPGRAGADQKQKCQDRTPDVSDTAGQRTQQAFPVLPDAEP